MTQSKFLFGPVPSRRLGLSLGVDIVPLKTCTQNCIYCQLGIKQRTVVLRRPYVDVDIVLEQLREKIDSGLVADFITLSGSGEPTLNSDIGRLIDGIRKMTDIRIALITNGTLLADPDVRKDCSKADVVLPSLDAGDEEAFQKINGPHADVNFDSLVQGLCDFRAEFTGEMWLEVFLSKDINTSDEQVEKIKTAINRINPDKVQLNTAVRPTADPLAVRVDPEQMFAIAVHLGCGAEVVADFSKAKDVPESQVSAALVLEMLKRRPCSLADIASGLCISHQQSQGHIDQLLAHGSIVAEQRQGTTYYAAK